MYMLWAEREPFIMCTRLHLREKGIVVAILVRKASCSLRTGFGRRPILLFASITVAITLACGALLGSAAAATCGSSWSTVQSALGIAVPRDIAAIAPDDV